MTENYDIIEPKPDSDDESRDIRGELEKALSAGRGPKVARFAMAILGGAIPIAGGTVTGAGAYWSESDQEHINKILQAWLKLQEDEIREIGITLADVLERLDLNDETIRERLESAEYLSIVRKCFREWAAAESEEKRILVRNLLANAGAFKLCDDDVVRLFVEWISKYSEAHFKVIRTIFKKPELTRRQIWQEIHGARVREDSAEADLFKLLIFDLSTGHVVRQHRETDAHGNFVAQRRTARRRSASRTLTSAFEDEKQYVLTELGKQFVHYTMNEIVPRLTAAAATSEQ